MYEIPVAELLMHPQLQHKLSKNVPVTLVARNYVVSFETQFSIKSKHF